MAVRLHSLPTTTTVNLASVIRAYWHFYRSHRYLCTKLHRRPRHSNQISLDHHPCHFHSDLLNSVCQMSVTFLERDPSYLSSLHHASLSSQYRRISPYAHGQSSLTIDSAIESPLCLYRCYEVRYSLSCNVCMR